MQQRQLVSEVERKMRQISQESQGVLSGSSAEESVEEIDRGAVPVVDTVFGTHLKNTLFSSKFGMQGNGDVFCHVRNGNVAITVTPEESTWINRKRQTDSKNLERLLSGVGDDEKASIQEDGTIKRTISVSEKAVFLSNISSKQGCCLSMC